MSKKLFDMLEAVEHCEECFGSLCTGRTILKRDIVRAVNKGLVKDIGEVELVDDDGFSYQTERLRTGYQLTEKGKKFLKDYREASHEKS